MECFVCCRFKSSFFCSSCIKNGDFTSSRIDEVVKERFAEKKLKLYKLRAEEEECNLRLKELLYARIVNCELEEDSVGTKENIQNLRALLNQKVASLEKSKESLSQLRDVKRKSLSKLDKLRQKKASAINYINDRKKHIESKRRDLRKKEEERKNTVKQRISQLTEDIFPIQSYLPDENPETGGITSEESTPLLTYSNSSSSNYNYSSNEEKFTIVEPWLPASGNYSAYSEWVTYDKDLVATSTSLSELGQRNPAYRISAALAYTAQLLTVLSFYFDIRFTKRLHFSEFYTKSGQNGNDIFLSDSDFADCIARLNLNIIYFCLCQKIDVRVLNPKHTIANTLMLYDPNFVEIGRRGPINFDYIFYKRLECMFQSDILPSSEPEYDAYMDNSEADLMDYDWENVPHMPATCSDLSIYSQQSTSLAGGFMSTAAASVASFWRVATGQK